MRSLALVAPFILLAGCAEMNAKMESYSLGRGLVTYDAMVRAKADCAAAGGIVRPKDEGGDMAQLSNYICEIQPKKAETK
jgi:hypothetical protein